MLVVQLEVPLSTVETAIELARRHDLPCLLDPAPAPVSGVDFPLGVDFLTPNATEAGHLLGQDIGTVEDAMEAARELCHRGVRTVLVTLGAEGCVLVDSTSSEHIPAPRVRAIDTTAAGDTFTGALAVRLCEGATPHEAARFACVAGALSTTSPGAQSGMPRREEVEETGGL